MSWRTGWSVERTPEVFVLDQDRAVRYRGRVDDQFGLGVHRPAPTAPRPVGSARRAARRPARWLSPGPSLPAAGSADFPSRAASSRSLIRRKSPGSCATGASPATGRARSPRFARVVQAGRRLGEHDR